MRVELVAIAGIVVAVAILTELRPGKDAPSAVPVAALPPVLPPRDAVVDARELGDLAVAVAREPSRTTVTIVGPDANGVDGKRVEVDGATATPCGSGCYRAPAGAHVTVDGRARTMRDPRAYTDLLCRLHPVGTPRVCADRLAATAERTGISRFALLVEGSGDLVETERNVLRLGGEVLPLLSDQ